MDVLFGVVDESKRQQDIENNMQGTRVEKLSPLNEVKSG